MSTPSPALLPTFDKITYSGVFGTEAAAAEIWSWSLTFEPLASSSDLHQRALQARQAYTAIVAPLMPPYVVLTRTRLAQIIDAGRVGHASDGSYLQADDLQAVPGAQALNVTWPLQTALCVSWSTARPGPTGKGRAFWPMPGFTLSSPGFVIGDNAAAAAVTAIRSLTNRLRGLDPAGAAIPDGQPGANPTVGRHVVASTHGTRSAVTSYRVGHVPDTMRSRRNALPENYTVLSANG